MDGSNPLKKDQQRRRHEADGFRAARRLAATRGPQLNLVIRAPAPSRSVYGPVRPSSPPKLEGGTPKVHECHFRGDSVFFGGVRGFEGFCPTEPTIFRKMNWRRGSESNRRCSFCRAVPYHLATPPSVGDRQIKGRIDGSASRVLENVESLAATGPLNHGRHGFATTPEQLLSGPLLAQESLCYSPRPVILHELYSSRLRRSTLSTPPPLTPSRRHPKST